MHIPDGYLGPQTYGLFYAVMTPIWFFASRILKKSLRAKHVSYLALGAAFSFVIMMFNIPAPGGSTGHVVGGTLIAIILGPWAALMAVSIALIIQALLFGDGGVTAIAANCFNMAFIMPFSGYYIYKMLSSKSEVSSPRQIFAAGVAGYISLNLAAFFTALEFGIQPLIAHTPDGTPLYAPYPLSVAVPVMAFEHLILFGFLEAVVTGLAVAYVSKTDPLMLGLSSVAPVPATMRTTRSSKGLWAFIVILVILTPLGLLASGTAWGEWSSDGLHSLLGFVPEGLKRLEGIWQYSFMADYNLPGWDSPLMAAMGYILSALVGVGVIVFVTFIMSRFISADRKS